MKNYLETNKPINIDNKLFITNQANIKLKTFVNLVNSEISGMAKSKITPEKDIIITDFTIFEQTVTQSHTSISDEAQAKFLNELMKKNLNPAEWNVWWHSHNDMDVFWSTTDDNTIAEHDNISYLISLVTNKKMEYKARIDVFPKDLSPFNKKTYCRFDINDIKIIKTKTEQLKEKQYEKELLKIEKEIDDKIASLDKKYAVNDNKIKTFCAKEIKNKVLEIKPVYDIPVYQTRKNYKPKKWNWINGWENNYNYDETYDLTNKQKPLIGFSY